MSAGKAHLKKDDMVQVITGRKNSVTVAGG